MANNPHRPGTGASNSFTRAEIELMTQVLANGRMGKSMSVLARSPTWASIERKFNKMKKKLEVGPAVADVHTRNARATFGIPEDGLEQQGEEAAADMELR